MTASENEIVVKLEITKDGITDHNNLWISLTHIKKFENVELAFDNFVNVMKSRIKETFDVTA